MYKGTTEGSEAAAVTIANGISKELKSLTSQNAHTDALIEVAEAFTFRGSLDELERIKAKQDDLGYLSIPLNLQRHGIYQHMMELIKEVSQEAHDIIHGCL